MPTMPADCWCAMCNARYTHVQHTDTDESNCAILAFLGRWRRRNGQAEPSQAGQRAHTPAPQLFIHIIFICAAIFSLGHRGQ